MNIRLEERINRAKELLQSARHAAMATVNTDGSPHNTPFLLILDESLEHVYWGSAPDSQHCQNLERTGQLFVVIYDAVEPGGLFIRADRAHMVQGKELERALKIHNQKRAIEAKPAVSIDYYRQDSPQRMYGATLREFWVNIEERDKSGIIIRDSRVPISRMKLL